MFDNTWLFVQWTLIRKTEVFLAVPYLQIVVQNGWYVWLANNDACACCVTVAICGVSLEWVCNNTVDLFVNSDNLSFTQVLEYLKRDKNCNFQDKQKTRKFCKMCLATWVYA